MRRSACGLFVLLIIAGCRPAGPTGVLGSPPSPLLSTRAPRAVRAIPKPVRTPTREVTPPAGRATITARDVRVPGGIKKSEWQTIVVHHSGTSAATPTGMDRYHRDVRKWSNGLGYHFVIGNGVKYPDGQLYVGQRWKNQQTGAHCAAAEGRYLGRWRPRNFFNEHGIGICLIGNFENERPTREQLRTLDELIRVLCGEAGVGADQVYGHGEITHKTACPGSNLNMHAVRRAVGGGD